MTEDPRPTVNQQQRRETHPPSGQKLPWLWIIPIPVALVIGLLIGIQLPLGPGSPAPEPTSVVQENAPPEAVPNGQDVPEVPDVARLDPEDQTAIGSVDAPVVMVAYTDFQCPYCAKFTDGTLPQLMDKYVDAGQLRIEWRDLDLFGETSKVAAHAAQAAAMQGKYVEFAERMAEGGNIADKSAYSDKNLQATAQELGMDGRSFRADMESKEAKEAVQRNIDEARSLGVMSTPSFLINKTPFVGAQPVENFEKAIDAQLETEGAK